MPITVTPIGPIPTAIGWGVPVTLQSTFVGPLPFGTTWVFNVSADADGVQSFLDHTSIQGINPVTFRLGWTDINNNEFLGQATASDGQTIRIDTQLIVPGSGTVDTGLVTMPWKAGSSDLPTLVHQLPAAGSGLTAAQSAQLTRVDNATKVNIQDSSGTTVVPLGQLLSVPLLQDLVLHEITSGPTAGFVAFTPAGGTKGLLVRITNIGPGYTATAADDGFYVPELAVIVCYRGTDVVGRFGLHEVSRFIYPLPGAWLYWLSLAPLTIIPPDYTVQITFPPGILGRVFTSQLP